MSEGERVELGNVLQPKVPIKGSVFIVDRYPCYIDGIAEWLTGAGYAICGQATSLEALKPYATKLASLDRPICIVGPNLKPCHAFDTCRRLRAYNPQVRVVYLAPDAEGLHTKAEAAYAGALVCLPGEVTADPLLGVLPVVLAGSSLIPLDALKAQPKPLSPRELDILRLIAEGKSDAEITLMFRIAETTLKTHVRRIMDKLDVHSRKEAIYRATNLGWLPCASEDIHPSEDTEITPGEDTQR